MGSSHGDLESERVMTAEAVAKLEGKYPKHELIKYWIIPPEERGPDGKPLDPEKERKFLDERNDKFWGQKNSWRKFDPRTVQLWVLFNYREAVLRAFHS